MNRIMLVIIGWFAILFALGLLWLASVPGRETIARAALGFPDVQPKDLALVVTALLALGLVVILGTALESVFAGVTGAVTGGRRSALRESERMTSDTGDLPFVSILLFGLAGYLAVGGIFGAYLVFSGGGGQGDDFARFTDLRFLQFLVSWPYHLMAAIGPFGLSSSNFY